MSLSGNVDLAVEAGDLVITVRVRRQQLESIIKGCSTGIERSLKGRRVLPSRSKIYRDADVRSALDAMVDDLITLEDMRLRLVRDWGRDRAPGRSAIGRYIRRRRIELGWLER